MILHLRLLVVACTFEKCRLKITTCATIIPLAFIFLKCAESNNHEHYVGEELKIKAINQITENLHTQDTWIKVHAAEYLIWLGYPKGVQEIYQEELRLHEDEKPYRIGIWRVMAQLEKDSAKRDYFIDRIAGAFTDTMGVDRVHAAETMAKLDANPMDADSTITSKVIINLDDPLSVYTLWAVINHKANLQGKSRLTFLNLITEDNTPSKLKKLAAYCLRFLGEINENQWSELTETALEEPIDSEAKLQILCAAFALAPDDSVYNKRFMEVKQELVKAKDSSVPADRMQMALTLGEFGSYEFIPVLRGLLDGANPIRKEDQVSNSVNNSVDNVNSDIRATAAYAILRVHQRESSSDKYVVDGN